MRIFQRVLLLAGLLFAGCTTTHKPPHLAYTPVGATNAWGIACLSVASAREQPDQKAEMATQILMGDIVRVLGVSRDKHWYCVESSDGYRCWLERGTFTPATEQEVAAWQRSSLLIVTALETSIMNVPNLNSEPVSDIVVADLLKQTGEKGDWYAVELPDRRTGFLPKTSAEDYRAWKRARQPTAENIERTARQFLGRPYLWGGTSPKGLDCSGLTKLVFYLNGIDLARNARDQSRQGVPVALDSNLSALRKGDLLFFGHPAAHGKPERVVHVGIYLENKLFIQSSGRVKISSLDPASAILDLNRSRTLLRARRFLLKGPA